KNSMVMVPPGCLVGYRLFHGAGARAAGVAAGSAGASGYRRGGTSRFPDPPDREGRVQLLEVDALAGRAGGPCVPEDQRLEAPAALPADVLEEGHEGF